MKIHYSKIFIFLTGALVGFILFIAYNTSSKPVYEWKNKSNTLILSVSHNGTNYGSLPFGDYHSFFLTPYANGKTVPRGTLITVSDNFSDYGSLKVEWLKDGCLITSKHGYKIFMPYP
ncbi:hypothetical protein [Moraxella cuniculi]|uniref:Uncharacterized protein n=1 Tax=Moraxella cuniculi TaxID=34061 RepID=A0A3S4SYW0_9GAMM|nr:hypothetical protein [Moraxella cuniculi]VEG12925.1 Uncharacterised protein [Moraxella cuniculi]